jgi:predicted NACHT family NTPase
LDEVPSQLRQSVRDQIYEFAKEYRKNRFVLTCRTQTIEYIADHFKPIEVANFDAQQVKIFARSWFTAIPETSEEAEGWTSRFVGKLEENKQIRELAVTPILLTLTCLLFTAEQGLPKKRSELYEKGSNLLLKQWDRFREIPRDYQQLSVLDKQKLLSYLAFRKFEQPDNFILFEQNEIQKYIAEHLKIEFEESEGVLKAIEAHHGLLLERANGIWSFSHLTFQEYFTARKIVTSCNPDAADDPTLQMLVGHVAEKRWREVFLLTVGIFVTVDILLRLMKTRIDGLLAKDEKLQQFLKWVDKKAQPFEDAHKPSVRAFYFALDPAFERSCIYPLNFAFKDKIDLDHFLAKTLDRFNRIFRFRIFAHVHFRSLGADLDYDLYCALKHVQDCKLRRKLQKLRAKLPVTPFETKAQSHQAYLESITEEEENFKQWWQRNGQAWVEQLRAVMIEHRNIGHNWQFSDEQKELLQQYYDANKLLVDCLNSDCYVSREVRQEIEETLLLPITEIEKRTEL